ncbi:uncharacterized protein L969DRAFT_350997 [Mixia osmundae IAM 14324]|uniref:uncharacterized protein n=1 Tax=Mixia osmundae (strain CBS 9802 / IAM 14324 / JCM 22182 / KY 12970) TaxID=764103 RepID=UPI0004A547DF|nr:uncharacterized protein L969DRAFT_350997 [Mixia osmundae IAM 14324]KEI40732.1 hypothetical protein L969DRAFT_350997 [Mixia osmundae IAM 14324]
MAMRGPALCRALARPTCQVRHSPRPRRASTALPGPAPQGVRVGYVFAALAVIGISATGYGLWDYFSAFRVWPKEIRGDLRSALRCKERGEQRKAEQFFQRALTNAEALLYSGNAELGAPLSAQLKVSGIAIALAALLEEQAKLEPALEIYEHAFEQVRNFSSATNEVGSELSMRGIALAQKIGEISQRLGGEDHMMRAEKMLSWSLEEMLRASAADQQRQSKGSGALNETPDETSIMASELVLPGWITQANLGASMENLGALYASKGQAEYALQLYIQALGIIMKSPDPAKRTPPPIQDRCHGATIMNNISSTIVASSADDRIKSASSWANKALEIARHTETASVDAQREAEAGECKGVIAVALYNLGMISELDGNTQNAIKLFREAREQARLIKLPEGVRHANDALRRLSAS